MCMDNSNSNAVGKVNNSPKTGVFGFGTGRVGLSAERRQPFDRRADFVYTTDDKSTNRLFCRQLGAVIDNLGLVIDKIMSTDSISCIDGS